MTPVRSRGCRDLYSTAPKITLPLGLAELEKMGLVETETGIPSKQYLDMTLNTRLEEFQKYGLPFGLIYVDLDNYGKILEKHGRFNANKIVRTVARTLHKNIRFDIVGRWSTEEFLVVLLNVDEGHLDIVANKLRLLVAESYITTETGMLSATVSMGASLVLRYDTVESLVKRGEQLMMHSQWLGKNRVSMSFVQKEMAWARSPFPGGCGKGGTTKIGGLERGRILCFEVVDLDGEEDFAVLSGQAETQPRAAEGPFRGQTQAPRRDRRAQVLSFFGVGRILPDHIVVARLADLRVQKSRILL